MSEVESAMVRLRRLADDISQPMIDNLTLLGNTTDYTSSSNSSESFRALHFGFYPSRVAIPSTSVQSHFFECERWGIPYPHACRPFLLLRHQFDQIDPL